MLIETLYEKLFRNAYMYKFHLKDISLLFPPTSKTTFLFGATCISCNREKYGRLPKLDIIPATSS